MSTVGDARWREIDSIFAAALEHRSAEWEAFLAGACHGDAELEVRLHLLLRSSLRAESFLETPIFSIAGGLRVSDAAGAGDGIAALPEVAAAEGTSSDRALRDPLGLSGRQISHFRVREVLDFGGMGIVYRAEDLRLERGVALKFLLPQYSRDPAAKRRFLREARAASMLDHPNVCTVYEADETDDGYLFLAMVYYAGETLRTRVARTGALPVEEAVELARQVALGLSAAHKAGIVHRDLKPGNLILSPEGTIKILDFGLSRVRDFSITRFGERAGTVAYMSPEQLSGAATDTASDLWSLGVVLYEMVSGTLPFGVGHELSTVHRVLHEEPTALSTLRPGIPGELDDLVGRLLRKDPEQRDRSAAGVAQALEGMCAGSITGSRPARIRSGGVARGVALRRGLWRAGALAAAAASVWLGVSVAAGIDSADPTSRNRQAPMARQQTVGLPAYQQVLRGRELIWSDPEHAFVLLRGARELDPAYPDAFAALAWLFLSQFQRSGERAWLDSSVVAARQAISLDPNFAEGHEGLGWALDRRGDLDASLLAHQRAIDLNPNLTGGLANLYHFGFGRFDEAVRWWKPALEADPANSVYLQLAGWAYMQLGMPERARPLFEKATAFEPDQWPPHYWFGVLLVMEGREAEARAHIERMVSAANRSSIALSSAGEIALYLGDLEAARDFYEEAHSPEPGAGSLPLAWLLQQAGETERARTMILNVARRQEAQWGGSPKRPEDFEELAKVRLMLGDREGALDQFERGVRRGWHSYYDRPLHPILRSLSGDPRFERLRAEMKASADRQRLRVQREGW
jgi:tetratricopeptide (TPR) repeat protein